MAMADYYHGSTEITTLVVITVRVNLKLNLKLNLNPRNYLNYAAGRTYIIEGSVPKQASYLKEARNGEI